LLETGRGTAVGGDCSWKTVGEIKEARRRRRTKKMAKSCWKLVVETVGGNCSWKLLVKSKRPAAGAEQKNGRLFVETVGGDFSWKLSVETVRGNCWWRLFVEIVRGNCWWNQRGPPQAPNKKIWLKVDGNCWWSLCLGKRLLVKEARRRRRKTKSENVAGNR
jgi:hypothetical protein